MSQALRQQLLKALITRPDLVRVERKPDTRAAHAVLTKLTKLTKLTPPVAKPPITTGPTP